MPMGIHRRWFLGVRGTALLLLWCVAAPARSEEGDPAAPAPDAVYPALLALRKEIAKFQVAPPRTRENTALYDCWSNVLKPRVSRMVAALDTWKDVRRWEFIDDDDNPDRLRPSAWPDVSAAAIRLYVDLAGSLDQYERFVVVWAPNARVGLVFAGNRAAAAARREAEKALDVERAAKAKEVAAAIETALDLQRQTLAAHIASVKTVIARQQEAEEDRLEAGVDRLSRTAKDLPYARARLEALRAGRLNGQQHESDSPARYGAILRQQWLRPRGELVRTLEGVDPLSLLPAEPVPASPVEPPAASPVEPVPADAPAGD
jgi:hypothetical protein